MIQDIDLHDTLLAYNCKSDLNMFHDNGYFGFISTYLAARFPEADLSGVEAYTRSPEKPFADRIAALVKTGYAGELSSGVYSIYSDKLAGVLIYLITV
jgi:hypothetical protein